MADLYKVLGVERNASDSEIKKAFRKQSLLYHPDKNSSPDATLHFQKIVEAYNHLLQQDQLYFCYDENEDYMYNKNENEMNDEIPETFDSFQSNIFQRTRKEWVLKIIESFFDKEHSSNYYICITFIVEGVYIFAFRVVRNTVHVT
jgi:DnaJ-class molecular chaperone